MEKTIERVHSAALRILGEVGIRLKHPGVLEMLRRFGVRVDGDTAFFTRDQIETWVAKAPSSFTLRARNPRFDVTIGGEHTELAPGYGCPTIVNARGGRRDAVLKDYLVFAALVHQYDLFGINGGILVQPADVAPQISHLAMFYAAARMSDKCQWVVPGEERFIRQTMEAAAQLFGGSEVLKAAPRLLTMISTISPLQVDRNALDSILVCGEYGQPVVISPAPAVGTTGPIDPGANLALATAEALACIALAQMASEGTPVVFGLQCYGSDLRTGNISIGSPAYALQARYTAALARFYGVPSRAGGAVSDAKGLTAQAGYESMLSMLTGYQNGINLMVHSAGIVDSFAGMSYEKFLVDTEIIRMVRYYRTAEVNLPDEDAFLELVRSVGPGGQFLTTQDTLRKCRTHSWNPEVSARGLLKSGTAEEQLLEGIGKRIRAVLNAYRAPDTETADWKAFEDYLTDRAGFDPALLHSIGPEQIAWDDLVATGFDFGNV